MVIGQNDDIRDNTPQLNNNHCTLDQVFRPCMGLGNSGADAVMRNESRRNDTISPEGKRPEHSIMLNRSCRPAVDQLSIGKERSGVMWLRRANAKTPNCFSTIAHYPFAALLLGQGTKPHVRFPDRPRIVMAPSTV
ncbi:hypothetical protein VCV18_010707 [Metarhizium anisopliae]